MDRRTFTVRCIKYNQSFEKFFSIGKEYEVKDGCITNDNGFVYGYDPKMTADSDPTSWFLDNWYEFEVVSQPSVPDRFEVTFDDMLEGVE